MVGAVRFELTTSCTRNKRATKLRYAPTQNDTLTNYQGNNQRRSHLETMIEPKSATRKPHELIAVRKIA